MANRRLTHLLAVIVGAAYVTVFAQWPNSGHNPPLMVVFLGSFVVMATFGFLLGRRARSVSTMTLSLFVGICAGVVVNVMYDLHVKRGDHNLWPFELVIVTFFAMPGFVAGALMARSEGGERSQKRN